MFQNEARNSVTKQCLSLLMLSFLFFYACGIDVYHIIEPPKCNNERCGQDDELYSFFEFITADRVNHDPSIVGDVKPLGTEIYYKIYTINPRSTSEIESIKNANTEYSDSGFNKMLSLDYKKLESDQKKSPIIQGYTTDTKVFVYLFPTSTQPTASIIVNNTHIATPKRTNNYGDFDFTDDSFLVGNDIYDNSSTTTENSPVWVNAYAVSVGSVNGMQQVYSSLCPLGFIQIKR